MNARYAIGSTLRTAGVALSALAVFSWVFYGAFANQPERQVTLHEAVQAIWQQADGPISAGDIQRSWVWGPQPLASTTESYAESPDGTRTLIYFDKARLDILDENADTSSPWFATGALLVSEMLAGTIQLGEQDFIEKPAPDIPLTGDLVQDDPVTYATLAEHASVAAEDEAEPAENTVGSEITAVLSATGEIDAEGMAGSGVAVSEYSDVTGHNIAAPFVEWARALPYPDLYLLGHPVSEPFWIQTQVLGTPKTVLVQAFERRVMTYTPDLPAEWQVESANVGQHYRIWREIDAPIHQNLVPLASGEPFGEELVIAAVQANVDPYMLVAVSRVVSNGNPFFEASFGHGLLGVDPDDAGLDPRENAEAGANALRAAMPNGASVNWQRALATYYGSPGKVNQTMDLFDELVEKYTAELASLASADGGESIDISAFGGPLDSGPVAYYDPSYTTDWWEWALTYYDGLGMTAPGWQNDPNGYYCVRPGYIPGERLQVSANGRTLVCTVGDMVADRDLANWLSKWSIEMNWPMFVALGLDEANMATVDYPGDWPKPPPTLPVTQPPTNDPVAGQPAPATPADPPVNQPALPAPPAPAPPSDNGQGEAPPPATETPSTPAPEPTAPAPEPTPTPTPAPLIPMEPIPVEPSTPIPTPPTPAPTPEPTPEPEPEPEPPASAPGAIPPAR